MFIKTSSGELHLQAAKKALRHLKGTINYEILYKKGGIEELLIFTDSDYAGDVKDRRSTSGSVFLMNSGAVSWSSRKQPLKLNLWQLQRVLVRLFK